LIRRDPLANPQALIERVYAYAAYRLGHGPDAEDVTSTVFENALRYLDTYDPSKGEPITWLLGIARHCVARLVAGRHAATLELDEAAASTEFEGETIERLSLDAALQELGGRDRELIALRYGADLRASQIAEIAGMTTNSVDVALHRALARLRAVIESQEDEENVAPVLDPVERSL
jgi:RNA polymerase sigma-70 factor, ECF subfamily